MTFDHGFGYSFLLFSSLLRKKREEENENEVAKFVIKNHAFLLYHISSNITDMIGESQMIGFSHLNNDNIIVLSLFLFSNNKNSDKKVKGHYILGQFVIHLKIVKKKLKYLIFFFQFLELFIFDCTTFVCSI